jgi:membrane protein
VIRLFREFVRDDLFALCGDMTFKMILSLFPLLAFAFSVIGFFQLDADLFLEWIIGGMNEALPPQVMEILNGFIHEVIEGGNAAVLSISLVFTIISASSGFSSIIRGINKTYGQKDTRGWLRRRILSIVLVFAFVAVIVLAMAIMVFSENLQTFLIDIIGSSAFTDYIFSLAGYFLSIFVILAIIVMIYKVSSVKKVRILDVLPGACVTVIFWILFSKLYSIYVSGYANYTVIYGSLGSVFIMLMWLNFITVFLLIGSEINALLSDIYEEKEIKRVL